MLDLFRRYKKTQEPKLKKIAPNNKLYIFLLFVSSVLTGFSLFFDNCNAVFTIWTSITCGAVASIIVAWLIDAANCRQASKKTFENRKTLFSNFYHVFDHGLQVLIYEIAENEHCERAKKWYEWIDAAKVLAQHNSDKLAPFLRYLMVFFDDISEQVIAIKDQEALLLDLEIISQDDIKALSIMLNICDTIRMTYNRSKNNDGKCFQEFTMYCGLMKGLIDYAPTLRPINNMMVAPSLYLKSIEAGIVSPNQETVSNDD